MRVEARACRIHQGQIHWHVQVCGCLMPLVNGECPNGAKCISFRKRGELEVYLGPGEPLAITEWITISIWRGLLRSQCQIDRVTPEGVQ